MIQQRMNEHINMFKLMLDDELLQHKISELTDVIYVSLTNGGRLLLCGNGGSASDAQHIAAEFVGRFQKERVAYDAEALNLNASSMTAISNDYDYTQIFARQIEAKGRRGDVFIGISTSGKSPNVIEALRKAKELGMITVLMTGDYNNESTAGICDYYVKVPEKNTARIQEAHIFIGHMIIEMLEEK